MGTVERGASVDEVIDRALAAINRGDRVTANALAGRVLAVDGGNSEAEDLLAAPEMGGEMRRMSFLHTDLVNSTGLSTLVEPEAYRSMVGKYRDIVRSVVDRFEGHITDAKGDGMLVLFGYPTAHENDVQRAVLAGLEITDMVARISEQATRRYGVELQVRVGVHRGLVYLDTAQADVYGLGANVAARVSGLAAPGTLVVSDSVAGLIRDSFDVASFPATIVKGVQEPMAYHRVLGAASPAPRRRLGPLVGRQREIARLRKSWVRAQAGTLSVPGLVFRGEAGIGKSRLACAAAELVTTAEAPVVELAGSSLHAEAGLYPVRMLLESRCGTAGLTGPAERLRLLDAEVRRIGLDATAITPALAPVLGIGPEVGYEPLPAEGRKLHQLICGAVTRYLLACVGAGPGLLIADDLQWFDPSTLDVLGALLESADGRLLVVLTGRSTDWLPRHWPVKVFDLAPLTDEQTDALVSALQPDLTAAERAVVRDRCDGIPFFIEQVVAGLGVVPDDAELGPRVDAAFGPPVPDALYEPLFARLRASADVVPVVEAAAIIGRHVDHTLLASVCALDEASLDDAIDELEDAQVLEPWGSHGWRFRHELLREVAAEMAPPSVRNALHARVADALIDGDPDWSVVAAHYERAERFADAAQAYQKASTDARRRGALAEAHAYLANALAQLRCEPAGTERDGREMSARLRRGLLTATARGFPIRETAADLERCLELGGSDLADDELVATLFALAIYYGGRSDLTRADQVIASLSNGIGEGRQWFAPWIAVLSGVMSWARGDFDAARQLLEQGNRELPAADQREFDAVWFMPHDPIATSHIHVALARFVGGDHEAAEAEMALAVIRARGLAFPRGPYSLANAHFLECWMRMESGELDRAKSLAIRLTELGERHGFDQWRVVGLAEQATVAALAALDADAVDLAELRDHIEAVTRFVDIWRASEVGLYLSFFDGVLAKLLIATGAPDAARARLDLALDYARATGMSFYDAELLRLRAKTHRSADAGSADLAAALELARRQGAVLFTSRVAEDTRERALSQ